MPVDVPGEAARIVLVVGGEPSGNDGGEVYLAELAGRYPAGAMLRYSLSRSPSRPGGGWLGHDHELLAHPREFEVLGPQDSLAPSTFGRNAAIRDVDVPGLARTILAGVRDFGADRLWIVLNSPVLIYLAAHLVEVSPVPVSVTVWDPPERFAVDLNFDQDTVAAMEADFALALAGAVGLGVISEGMMEAYGRRSGAHAVIVRQGLAEESFKPTAALPEDGVLTVGLAGNLYAGGEWRAFWRALEEADWRIGGREVRLVALTGGEVPAPLRGRGSYPGWLPQDRAVEAMAACQVCYLPYWFDPAQKTTVRLCFPSKLSLYVAAGRPVFFHGPEDSSVGRFFTRYPIGVCCRELDPAAIRRSLHDLADDAERYRAALEAVESARREELNLGVFLARAASFLGLAGDAFSRGRG